MSDVLLVSVRLHDGWYHGSGTTPSPARMFQALVAGVGISGPLDEATISSLKWLEELKQPPIVAVPSTTRGQAVVNYVPNNDLDSRQGDFRRIGEIRTKKPISPLLFDPEIPFLFAWRYDGGDAGGDAERVCQLADRVYQLGRTVDMAWAWAELLTSNELRDRLNSYPGIVRYPSPGSGDVECPTPGSFESLNRRYTASAERFGATADRKGQTFRRRPKPKWKKVSYEGIGAQLMLELRRAADTGFAPWPMERTIELVTSIRDAAVEKLGAALPEKSAEIQRVLIGRKPSGENDGPTSARVRIIPLPSVGHPQADIQIRRVLVDIPGKCPIRSDDIAWAISGLRLLHPVLREPIDVTRSDDRSQLQFYGADQPSRTWRTITPVALPDATRRRIEPNRGVAEAKSGQEKYHEHIIASFAVAQALRHAGIRTQVQSVRVQREPFDRRGSRAEPFAIGTRFSKHSLWHVELELENPVSGPLVIGDGRFCGLGLMKPVVPIVGVFAFSIESGLNRSPDPIRVARALRRAVMARIRDVLGTHRLPPYFTGHRDDGAPAQSEDEPHLAFVFDPLENHLFVIPPEYLDRHVRWRSTENLNTLGAALENFGEIRAGSDGHLRICRISVDWERHRLCTPSRVWESVTPYQVNRHARRLTAEQILRNDLVAECERRALPQPEVTVLDWCAPRQSGLQGRLRLKFREVIEGPVILGKTRHMGGGVFSALFRDSD